MVEPIQYVWISIYWGIAICMLLMALVLTRGGGQFIDRRVHGLTRTLLFTMILSKLMMVLVLSVDDIRRLLVYLAGFVFELDQTWLMRSWNLSALAILFGLLPVLLIPYGIIRNRFRYRIYRNRLSIKGLPKALEGKKIVQFSDLHVGSFNPTDPVYRIVDLINAEHPDFIFFTGDLVNNAASEMRPFVDVFSRLRAKHGVFSVTGNHDYGDYKRWHSVEGKRQNFEHLVKLHERMGWRLLMNEHVVVPVDGATIGVLGVENISAKRFQRYGDMNKAHLGLTETDFNVLLSHDPSHWDMEVNGKFKNVDLTLSGHTHGFQFGLEWKGFFKWSPVQYVYKQWAGLYEKDDQYLYVNRGIGFLGYPGRIGILPEITVIELVRDGGNS